MFQSVLDRLKRGTDAYKEADRLYGEQDMTVGGDDIPTEERPNIWELLFQPWSPKVQAYNRSLQGEPQIGSPIPWLEELKKKVLPEWTTGLRMTGLVPPPEGISAASERVTAAPEYQPEPMKPLTGREAVESAAYMLIPPIGKFGKEAKLIHEAWNTLKVAERIKLVKNAGLKGTVAGKAWAKLLPEEKAALSVSEFKAIPKAEVGMPEAGLQPSMIPEEVAAKEVRPVGKGIVTQISMDEAARLEAMRTQESLSQAQQELTGLKETLTNDPVAQARFTIGGKSVGLDHFASLREGTYPDYFTVKEAEALFPGHDFTNLTKKGRVPRDAALDDLSKQFGMTPDEIANRVMQIRQSKARITQLENDIRVGAANIPLPPPATAEEATKQLTIPGKPVLTEAQANRALELFGKYIDSPDMVSMQEMKEALWRTERGKRFGAFEARMQELYIESGDAEKAFQQAKKETLSGKLPVVRTDYLDDLTDTATKVFFAKTYHFFAGKNEPTELVSTLTALTEALTGKAIPRIVGKGTPTGPFPEGGSAWLRLNRVFGEQPQVMKALEKMAEEKKPLRDVVEGIFRETPTEPIPVDKEMADYLRSLSTKGMQETTGLVPPSEGRGLFVYDPTGKLGLNLQAGQLPLTDAQFAAIQTMPERRSLATMLLDYRRQDLMSNEEFLTRVKGINWEKIDADESLKLANELWEARGRPGPTHYEPPIEEAIKEIPLWPAPARDAVIKVLKEIGMSPVDIGGFLKAMKSSVDMSYWRQITPLIPNHKVRFALSNIDAWKALFSQKSAETSWLKIIHDPEEKGLYAIYDALQGKQGRDFLRPFDMPKGTAQWKGVEEFGYLTEERFIPKLTAKIPTIKWSNRAFVTGTNSMSWGVFKDFYQSQLKIAEKYASGELKLKAGESFDIVKNMDAYATMLADWTGRASLGKLATAAPILGNLFYAPRYALGRIIGPRHLFSANPYVRKEAWKDGAMFVGTIGGAVLLGRQLGFWDVETNRNSADFMKIRVGNLRIDPWGGAQQFVVFFSRVFDLLSAPITGEQPMSTSSVTGAKYPLEMGRLTENLLRSKAAPLVGLFNEYMSGKTFGGEKLDVKNVKQWADRIAPMAIMDVWDAIQDQPTTIAIAGITSFAGFGVQTYTGDWKENATKLGLQKYPENLSYGIKEPVYDVKDFWADTASQFKGVDPATLTEAKGFPPKIKAIAEALAILKDIDLIPNHKLTELNADPTAKEPTFQQYYKMWVDRQALAAEGDEKKLKAFDADKRTSKAYLGNMTQRQFALLSEYHLGNKYEKAQFLREHPELDLNQREEWLKSHPTENIKLVVHDQSKVLTQEVYDKAMQMLEKLDYPDSAITHLPPKNIAKSYFEFMEIVDRTSLTSNEAKRYRRDHTKLNEWGIGAGKWKRLVD